MKQPKLETTAANRLLSKDAVNVHG